jgi:hypothetical protein
MECQKNKTNKHGYQTTVSLEYYPLVN